MSSYDDEVLADLPYFFWKLNETSGTIAQDATGNGHVGVYANGPTHGAASLVVGETETSTSFAAVSNQSVVQNDTYSPGTLTTFSLEIAFQPTQAEIDTWSASAASSGLFGWYATPVGQMIFFEISGTLNLFANGSLLAEAIGSTTATNQPPVITLIAGTKYHAVFTYDGTTAQIWVNGTLVNTVGPVTIGPFTHPGKFYVASSPLYGPYDGLAAKAAYYEYTLTRARIIDHYQSFIGINPSGFLSTDDLITEVENHLLGGDRDELNFLQSGMAAGDQTLKLSQPLAGETQGSYLGCELEVMYVKSVDSTSQTVTVRRGMLGSPVTAHPADAIVYVNPLFSKWSIFQALNVEITSLSGADNGLFAEKAFTVISKPVQKTYDVPTVNADLRRVLEIRYDAVGPEKYWPEVRRRHFQVIRDVTMDSPGATGLAVRIEESFTAGRRIVVRYAGDFLPLSQNLNDNAATTTLLTTNMIDIPALGAAARLMGVREAKRSFVERAVDSRRAAEVPSGSSSRAAGVLLQLLNGRIKSEADRLRQLWGLNS